MEFLLILPLLASGAAFIAIAVHMKEVKSRLSKLEMAQKEAELRAHRTADLKIPSPQVSSQTYERGDRVRVNQKSGFHKGAVGVVEFQEPNGDKCWVTRDGSGGPCYFHNYELEPE